VRASAGLPHRVLTLAAGAQQPASDVGRALSEHIVRYYFRSQRTYGARRIVQHLRRRKLLISRQWSVRLMRKHRLQGPKSHRCRRCATHGGTGMRLRRTSCSTGPDQVWFTAISYVPTQKTVLYLARLLNCLSRQLVGWAFVPSIHETLTLLALRRAILTRCPDPGVLHHSDRGVPQASGEERPT
jgi:putative transposase